MIGRGGEQGTKINWGWLLKGRKFLCKGGVGYPPSDDFLEMGNNEQRRMEGSNKGWS